MSWSEASRRRILAGAAAGLATALLSGCGFRPLYGEQASAAAPAELAQIQLPRPSSRLAQLVYVPLADRLNPSGRQVEKRYRLDLALSETESGVLITRSDEVTRINLTLFAAFAVVDLEENTRLFDGTAKSVASYNVLRSDYANLTGYDDARERAAADLAEQLSLRIGVYFSDPQRR
ncbi:hypothetical protein ACFOGJ_02925 [Marinibaculum pumilum]|uniref:LPS-assembly lipoprotein n=1 Tax=Marinibaculum pumilum TaxID=1766165 RepID=A0ABV7KUV8_9PROT